MENKFVKILISLIPNKKIRTKLHNKFQNKPITIEIKENTKCLMVAPHADDEIIGAGGLLIKYAKNFDCVCISSSGLKYKDISAKERSAIRIQEFNDVMKKLGIITFWIFEMYGIPPFINEIKSRFLEYKKQLDLKKYDYIFMPNPFDNHPEHKYITNKLFKKLLKNNHKKNLKIVFYEVWTPILEPNYFEDISDFINKKMEILSIYASQLVVIDYLKRTKGLNTYRGVFANNCEYAEAYKVLDIKEYFRI